jgi:phage antirepressor YoqD-like protein
MQSQDALYMNDAAKVLKLGYGNITLFKKLREMKILMDDNVPYQEYIKRGYFKADEKPVPIGDAIKIKRVIESNPERDVVAGANRTGATGGGAV